LNSTIFVKTIENNLTKIFEEGIPKEQFGMTDFWEEKLMVGDNYPVFIEQLKQWHDSDEHQKIIDAVEQIPLDERNFEITGMYARALNNAERYQDALDQLMAVEEDGREDGVWNFRVGYSLYYLKRKPEAAEYFQRAIDYGDDCDDTREMLKYSLTDDTWDYLFEYIDKYEAILNKYPDGKMTDHLNDSQITLLAYNFLYGQVSNGGFIQLIQNGYGGLIFDTVFSEIIKEWGAENTGKIVEEAGIIYNKYKNELEREKSMEEFSEIYEKIKDFEPLEDRFYSFMKDETKIIKKYVEENVNYFAITE
jgi:tetratricopeptide (TPR) repeat protein